VCRRDFDPTVTFQRCTVCGGTPRLRIRRYECSDCGSDIDSRFVFDGLVFDAEYFRRRMIEHRERKRKQRERVRRMLADSRSPALLPDALDLSGVPGLLDAINDLTSSPTKVAALEPKTGFDLKRYQRHIRAHIQEFPISFGEIPRLVEDARLDRVWRFVAIIFLAHTGLIDVWQDGLDVMVMQGEIDGEGQDVSGNLEDVDGVEGAVGRVEA